MTTVVNYIGVEGAAFMLGVKEMTIYTWVRQHKIPHYKIGRLVRFDPAEITNWMSKNKVSENKFDKTLDLS